MRKRATDGTKISTSLSITKNTVSTRSRAERLRIGIAGSRPWRRRLRSTRQNGELPVVRHRLLGVIVAIAAVHTFVPFQRRGMQLAFGCRDHVEMPAGILAAPEPGTHPHLAGQ